MTPQLFDFIKQFTETGDDPETIQRLLAKDQDAQKAYSDEMTSLVGGMIHTMSGPVYRVPMLSPEQCEALVAAAAGYSFRTNSAEQPEARIEEVVLGVVDPGLYAEIKKVLLPRLSAYGMLLYANEVRTITSIQLAKYRPGGTPGTAWHHDQDSDLTCVISLNPGDFEGGGTGVRVAADSWSVLPPLPKGFGMMFNGRSVQHRGLPVTAGERLLLVIWTRT